MQIPVLEGSVRTGLRCPARISITFLHVLAHVPSRSGTRGRLWFWVGLAQERSEHVMFLYVLPYGPYYVPIRSAIRSSTFQHDSHRISYVPPRSVLRSYTFCHTFLYVPTWFSSNFIRSATFWRDSPAILPIRKQKRIRSFTFLKKSVTFHRWGMKLSHQNPHVPSRPIAYTAQIESEKIFLSTTCSICATVVKYGERGFRGHAHI